MADLNVIARTTAVALVAATPKTVLQVVAPANHRLKVKEIDVSFDGISNVEKPVLVELMYQTTAGTASALTLVKEDDSQAETPLSTALQTYTVEPTLGNVIRAFYIHPQTGVIFQLPLGDEIRVGGGKRLAVRCTAPAAVNVTACVRFEE